MFVASTRERQKIPVSEITRGPNTARLSCSSKAITIRERISKSYAGILSMGGTQMKRERIKGPESRPSLALSVRPIYYQEAPQWPPFYILKKIDNLNFQ
jgi:hypothetical protein